MTLGEKLRQARLDCGLSQKQAAGGQITRNMLSLAEADRARPSMKTLEYLAGLYRKPLSWFLDESTDTKALVDQARTAYRQGDWQDCLQLTASLEDSDEGLLLRTLAALAAGMEALEVRRWTEALRMAETALEAGQAGLYRISGLLAQAQLLRARCLLELDGSPTAAQASFTRAAGEQLALCELAGEVLGQLGQKS